MYFGWAWLAGRPWVSIGQNPRLTHRVNTSLPALRRRLLLTAFLHCLLCARTEGGPEVQLYRTDARPVVRDTCLLCAWDRQLQFLQIRGTVATIAALPALRRRLLLTAFLHCLLCFQ